MPQSDFLKAFLTGTPATQIRMAAARGVLPLPADEMLQILVHLLGDADSAVAAQAGQTLQTWPEESVVTQLKSPACASPVMDYFAAHPTSSSMLEAIILNSSAQGPTIALLASRVPEHLLEAVLYNRVRLLETPQILTALKQNPNITARVLAQVQEIETEFFGDKKSEYLLEEAEEEIPEEEVQQLLESELTDEDLSLEGLPIDPDEREGALLDRISKMPVPNRIKAAMVGPPEVRSLLIRDTNRQVSRSVLKSPKITDREIETFAAMRSVSEDILREIGTNRVWSKNYIVKQNLVKNPKTPLTLAQRLIPHLHTKELTKLSRDRTISEDIRRGAARTLAQRTPPKRA
jgi:hypothetical protein